MQAQQLGKEFLKNSTFHAAKFTIDKDSTTIEKIFWLICIFLSWFAAFLLMQASLDAFRNNAIRFVVETSFLDWETDFPTIAICETSNMDRMQELANQIFGNDHDFAYEEILNELAYFRGESYQTINECANLGQTCISSNFSFYARYVRSKCKQTVENCQFNGIPFKCCDYFRPLETEMGTCYALNSIQTNNALQPSLNMKSNRFTGPGVLTMDVITFANVYTIGPEEVPSISANAAEILKVTPYVRYKRKLAIKNIVNDEETRDVSVEQRKCRFNDENYLKIYRYFSYTACLVQCRLDKSMILCNCSNHFMPNVPEHLYCNLTGIQCLNDNYDDLSIVLPYWAQNNRKGIHCDCLPSCTELDTSITIDQKQDYKDAPKPTAKVEIGMASLPTERYNRNVVRGKLDLVVSMGGAVGLFVGASLLSFIEAIYYFTVRPYITKKYTGLK